MFQPQDLILRTTLFHRNFRTQDVTFKARLTTSGLAQWKRSLKLAFGEPEVGSRQQNANMGITISLHFRPYYIHSYLSAMYSRDRGTWLHQFLCSARVSCVFRCLLWSPALSSTYTMFAPTFPLLNMALPNATLSLWILRILRLSWP